jgi:hypothetical protein
MPSAMAVLNPNDQMELVMLTASKNQVVSCIKELMEVQQQYQQAAVSLPLVQQVVSALLSSQNSSKITAHDLATLAAALQANAPAPLQ